MAMNEVDAALERWEKQGDELKEKLQAERAALLEKLAKIDEALVKLGCTVPTVKRTYKARQPRAATPPADAFAIPPASDPAPPGDTVAEALVALRPFWSHLPNGRDRAVVEMRAKGKLPADIGAALKIDKGVVSNIVFRVRGVLQAAREAATKPAEVD